MESGLSFSTIMQQAAKMKGAELDSMRTRFNSWPQHLQNSLFFDEGELRGRNVRDRLAEAAKRKEDASALLGKGEIMEALTLYERALGLFRWVASSDPGWRRNGIRDACLELHVDEGSGPEEAGRVRAMRLALLNNVALCHWHLQQFDKCIRACDEALEVDPACIKALYRRAKARHTPASSGATELDMAILDLKRAMQIVKDGGPASVGRVEVRAVESELSQLVASRRRQVQADRATFSGLFERGELYRPRERRRRRAGVGAGSPAGRAGTVDGDSAAAAAAGGDEEGRFMTQLSELRSLLRDLQERGREDEAAELEDVIRRAEAQGPAGFRRSTAEAGVAAEARFEEPTEEMKREAAAFGIDLDDPEVRQELKRLQLEAEAGRGAGAGSAAEGVGGTDRVPLARRPTERQLSSLPSTSNRVFWVTFTLMLLVAVYRIWSMGLMAALWKEEGGPGVRQGVGGGVGMAEAEAEDGLW